MYPVIVSSVNPLTCIMACMCCGSDSKCWMSRQSIEPFNTGMETLPGRISERCTYPFLRKHIHNSHHTTLLDPLAQNSQAPDEILKVVKAQPHNAHVKILKLWIIQEVLTNDLFPGFIIYDVRFRVEEVANDGMARRWIEARVRCPAIERGDHVWRDIDAEA